MCLEDHGKDLEKYLEYCKDVVFAGLELPFEDQAEDQIIEHLWNFYHKEEVCLCIYYFQCVFIVQCNTHDLRKVQALILMHMQAYMYILVYYMFELTTRFSYGNLDKIHKFTFV